MANPRPKRLNVKNVPEVINKQRPIFCSDSAAIDRGKICAACPEYSGYRTSTSGKPTTRAAVINKFGHSAKCKAGKIPIYTIILMGNPHCPLEKWPM